MVLKLEIKRKYYRKCSDNFAADCKSSKFPIKSLTLEVSWTRYLSKDQYCKANRLRITLPK